MHVPISRRSTMDCAPPHGLGTHAARGCPRACSRAWLAQHVASLASQRAAILGHAAVGQHHLWARALAIPIPIFFRMYLLHLDFV